MRLVLDYELLRNSLAAWREAIHMATGESVAPRETNRLGELERMLSLAIQKVDGCLAVLTICEADDADARSFDSLVGELRTFRTWLEQGLSAVRMMRTAP